jgi:hypothetical protein
MLYSAGSSGGADSRRIRLATTDDISDPDSWDFSDTTPFMEPVSSTWESHWTYACSMLKDGLSPYPYVSDDGWMLYFSGYNGSTANSGLAYLEPS